MFWNALGELYKYVIGDERVKRRRGRIGVVVIKGVASKVTRGYDYG